MKLFCSVHAVVTEFLVILDAVSPSGDLILSTSAWVTLYLRYVLSTPS